MKKYLQSYITFTRIERIGLIGLSGILIILICIRASMFLWLHPDNNIEKNKRLATVWNNFKQNQRETENSAAEQNKKDYVDAFDANSDVLPEMININTADSSVLVRLKGIGPITAGKIVARRKNKGPFTNIKQLLEIRHFPDATFKILSEHLSVTDSIERK